MQVKPRVPKNKLIVCENGRHKRVRATPSIVEWEMAGAIKAYFLATTMGLKIPQTIESMTTPIMALIRKSYSKKSNTKLNCLPRVGDFHHKSDALKERHRFRELKGAQIRSDRP